VIAYVKSLQASPNYGGTTLGSLGPVSEGLAAWVLGIGSLVCICVWIASSSVRSQKRGKS
jgi:ubiquinol-cytochrome c reductase cytochrome c subunit